MSPKSRRANLHILQRRGDHTEGIHEVRAALCDASGNCIESIGSDTTTTWRSAAKPFQLEASLSLLPQSLWTELTTQELAIGAASHTAEPFHTETVRKLTTKLGGHEDELLCGGHWPIHEPTQHALIESGHSHTAIHNNCSGKHTFMIAAARHQGAPIETYLEAQHPVQQTIHTLIDERTNGAVVDVVTDGCGVPCFVLPLAGMARAWASLGQAVADPSSQLGRIGQAMLEHPEYVSGTGRLDRIIAENAVRPCVTKVGAAALICGTVPGESLGFAIKILSASSAARPAACLALLNRWFGGLLPSEPFAEALIVPNVVGKPVGGYEPHWN